MNTPLALAFGMPGPMELVVLAIVMVLLFGGRLPQVMRSIGSSIPEFRKGLAGIEEDVKKEAEAVKEGLKSE